MHDQHVAGRQIGQEIFRPATKTGHRLAFQPGGKIPGQTPAQIVAPHLDLDEAGAFHDRRKTAPDCFHLG